MMNNNLFYAGINIVNTPDKSLHQQKHDYYMKYVKGLWDNYADSNIVSDDVVDNIDKFESCVAEVR